MSDNKGISVLIPVYNHDIRLLVQHLVQQGEYSGIPFEVRCYDDFSKEPVRALNREITALASNVVYLELDKNLGRSKIRNKLAAEAAFGNLLFLDCDSYLPDSNFLKRYSQHLAADLVAGGRIYHTQPASERYALHWKVGKSREEREASQRARTPYKNFMTNNFMVRKNIYFNIWLDESLEGYGHEDTKFGYKLKEKNINVIHIDNPVIHDKLDNNEEFLLKTREGIKNFYLITREGYGRDLRLYRIYRLLKKFWLSNILKACYGLLKKRIEKNLLSPRPSLFFYDIYKLYFLIQEESLVEDRSSQSPH